MTYYMWSGYHTVITISVEVFYTLPYTNQSVDVYNPHFCLWWKYRCLGLFLFFWLICIFEFIFQGDVLDKVLCFFLRIISSRDFQKSPRAINPFFYLITELAPIKTHHHSFGRCHAHLPLIPWSKGQYFCSCDTLLLQLHLGTIT